jgi:hypothetical protein
MACVGANTLQDYDKTAGNVAEKSKFLCPAGPLLLK